MKPILGMIVIYTDTIEDGKTVAEVWPALVWKVYTDMLVSLTVFRNGLPYRYNRVWYLKEGKPETWRFQTDIG